jgi:hypothetical protein
MTLLRLRAVSATKYSVEMMMPHFEKLQTSLERCNRKRVKKTRAFFVLNVDVRFADDCIRRLHPSMNRECW